MQDDLIIDVPSLEKPVSGQEPEQDQTTRVIIAQRLERLRAVVGAENDTQLARSLELTPQSVSGARDKNQIPAYWFVIMSEKYGASAEWLLSGEGPMWRRELVAAVRPDGRELDRNVFDLVPMAEAKLSAGGGAVVLAENVKDYYAFRKDWLHKVAAETASLVLMRVVGESMHPTVCDGDTVMIDQARKSIYDGNIYAMGQEDLVYIKRLQKLPGGRLHIISDNERESPPYEARASEIRIIGQVIWYARELVKT
jgi:phage repressor protein C with HTH and peptisase S24 domain